MKWVEVDGKVFNLDAVRNFDNFDGEVYAVFDNDHSIHLASLANETAGIRFIYAILRHEVAEIKEENDA